MHFELVLVYCVRYLSFFVFVFILLHMYTNCPSIICWNDWNDWKQSSFFIELPSHLCEKQLTINKGVISWLSILFHWYICLSLCQYHILFIYSNFMVKFEVRYCKSSSVFLLQLLWLFWVLWVSIPILGSSCQFLSPKKSLLGIHFCCFCCLVLPHPLPPPPLSIRNTFLLLSIPHNVLIGNRAFQIIHQCWITVFSTEDFFVGWFLCLQPACILESTSFQTCDCWCLCSVF